MKVLVTGACGFLAPHVAAALAARGHQVIGCDSRPQARPTWAAIDGTGLWHEFRQAQLDTVEGAAEAVHGVDAICHLAGVGDVYLAFERPEVAAAANVVATACLLKAAGAAEVRKFTYASTWEVYGQPQYQPLDEMHPCNPDHPYNITKFAGERLVIAADHLRQLPCLALRLGTAYGRGMRPNSVFSIFINRARRGEPITISGDGSQGRQFTHTSDIANAFCLAVESEHHGAALNAVAERLISIRELAEAVVQRYPTEIVYGPARVGDIAPALVSSAQIHKLLGWRARTDLATALPALFEEHEHAGATA